MTTTKATKATKAVKTTTTTAVNLDVLLTLYLESLSGLESAKAGTMNTARPIALAFDQLGTGWSLAIKWGKSFPTLDSMTSDKLAKVASDTGLTVSKVKTVAMFRMSLVDQCKVKGIKADQAWQNIQRHSSGYTGSKPMHPEVVAAQVAKESKPAAKVAKEPAINEMPLQDAVKNNPALAKTALTQMIAGLKTCAKLRKVNKVGTDQLKELIASLEEALELSLTVK